MHVSRLPRWILITLVPAIQLGLLGVAAPARAALNTSELEGDIVYLTNKQRELHDCKAVHVDARLAQAGTAHSAYMARTGTFAHIDGPGGDFVSRVLAVHYPRPLGENIAFGFRTGVDVVKAWLDSPRHRANLLNCDATAVGVGVVLSAGGTPYITEDFGA
jgi:uncharacterized protein YkwD